MVEKYEPEIIWSDGYGPVHSDYWNVTEFLAWYATNSTVHDTAVWNDRWGRDTMVRRDEYIGNEKLSFETTRNSLNILSASTALSSPAETNIDRSRHLILSMKTVTLLTKVSKPSVCVCVHDLFASALSGSNQSLF